MAVLLYLPEDFLLPFTAAGPLDIKSYWILCRFSTSTGFVLHFNRTLVYKRPCQSPPLWCNFLFLSFQLNLFVLGVLLPDQHKDTAVSYAGVGSWIPGLHPRPGKQLPPQQMQSESKITSETSVSQSAGIGVGVEAEAFRKAEYSRAKLQDFTALIQSGVLNDLNKIFPH